jgi:hypothetical protein
VLALVVAWAVVVGCGGGFAESRRQGVGEARAQENARREVARLHAALESSCSDVALVVAVPDWFHYVAVGCGVVAEIEARCERGPCTARRLSASKLERPRRLEAGGKTVWHDPSLMAEIDRELSSAPNPKVVPVRLSIDIRQPPYRVGLPDEYRRYRIDPTGLFRICVTKRGQVASVEVLRSPERLEVHWIATIEKWQYQPPTLDGVPVPSCYTQKLQVEYR